MSNVGQSFKEALVKIAEEEDKPIEIYDYCNECDLKKLCALNEPRHIIIVWYERSDEQSNEIKQTPMRWALDFSTKVLDSTSEAALSISIVDLTGEKHDRECGMRMRKELLAEMPWVKLYAPLVPESNGEQVWFREGYTPILGDPCSLLKEVNDNSGSKKICLNSCGKTPEIVIPYPLLKKNTLTSLANQWDASLELTDEKMNQLIQLIWLLFQENNKSREIDLDTWWHKPFRSDESVPSYLVLLDRLSERCGEILGQSKNQADEDISAVLERSDDSNLGFGWTFAGPTSSKLEFEYNKKKKFKELIDSCKEQLAGR